MENLMERITIDGNICNGKPSIRGKRITVQTILGYLAAGDSADEILSQYLSLEMEDIRASLQYAIAVIDHGFTIKSVA
jgi:uncharacterized protein (DUF433 family)